MGVGGGNSGLEVALLMVRIASKVYLVAQSNKLTGDKILVDRLNSAKNIEIMLNTKILEIKGEKLDSG